MLSSTSISSPVPSVTRATQHFPCIAKSCPYFARLNVSERPGYKATEQRGFVFSKIGEAPNGLWKDYFNHPSTFRKKCSTTANRGLVRFNRIADALRDGWNERTCKRMTRTKAGAGREQP